MKTQAERSSSGWEWLTETTASQIEPPLETAAKSRPGIMRRFQTTVGRMFDDDADEQSSPEPRATVASEIEAPRNYRSKHGLPGPPDVHKRAHRLSAPRHASN
jgi:hypothetical protein